MVFEKIKGIIADRLGIDENEIKLESNFVNDLGADSLDVVELVMALEEEFEVEIADEDAEKVGTVNDVVKYVSSKIEE
ncbi:acyl carrier protein [Oceanirhabdus seepicola]|uniref:Acyl carrier protein n=1 Tax=Oceanirhabdus seepicola TaxID=2828781 RepID=A0A9J6P3G9_9CLOT|nr:acyl carrier protein [Oceanirhabdus seepicola]MCM1991083.1 acyl carrier protein [Oceanirhabdus seepicola]